MAWDVSVFCFLFLVANPRMLTGDARYSADVRQVYELWRTKSKPVVR